MQPTDNPTQIQLTPLSKLQADKERLQAQCRLQEQKLNGHFLYMQENAGSLLLSGVSALLSSTGSSKSTKKDNISNATSSGSASQPDTPLGIMDMLSLGSGMIPLAWEVAQPFLITWSIKRVKSLIGRVFTRKGKTSRKN